ncbi:hypothetical protein, partial [Myxococcus virescens]
LEGMPHQRVVLESGGVQVVEDGSVTLASGTTEWWALGVLGNALAEAKRGTAHAHGLLDVNTRALSQAVRHAAQLGARDFHAQASQALLERRDQMAGRTDERGRRRGLEEAASIIRSLLGKAVRRG